MKRVIITVEGQETADTIDNILCSLYVRNRATSKDKQSFVYDCGEYTHLVSVPEVIGAICKAKGFHYERTLVDQE